MKQSKGKEKDVEKKSGEKKAEIRTTLTAFTDFEICIPKEMQEETSLNQRVAAYKFLVEALENLELPEGIAKIEARPPQDVREEITRRATIRRLEEEEAF